MAVDDQEGVHCRVTESRTAETNPKFVKIVADQDLELPAGVKRGDEFEITYSFTENQTMATTFVHKASGSTANLNLSFRRLLKTILPRQISSRCNNGIINIYCVACFWWFDYPSSPERWKFRGADGARKGAFIFRSVTVKARG